MSVKNEAMRSIVKIIRHFPKLCEPSRIQVTSNQKGFYSSVFEAVWRDLNSFTHEFLGSFVYENPENLHNSKEGGDTEDNMITLLYQFFDFLGMAVKRKQFQEIFTSQQKKALIQEVNGAGVFCYDLFKVLLTFSHLQSITVFMM